MSLRNKERHPPQAGEEQGQVEERCSPEDRAVLGTLFYLRAELYQPCAIEAVDAVIFAKMAGQSSQVSLRGDPLGVRADLVRPNLAPLDRYTGVEQAFDAFQPFFRLQRTGAVD